MARASVSPFRWFAHEPSRFLSSVRARTRPAPRSTGSVARARPRGTVALAGRGRLAPALVAKVRRKLATLHSTKDRALSRGASADARRPLADAVVCRSSTRVVSVLGRRRRSSAGQGSSALTRKRPLCGTAPPRRRGRSRVSRLATAGGREGGRGSARGSHASWILSLSPESVPWASDRGPRTFGSGRLRVPWAPRAACAACVRVITGGLINRIITNRMVGISANATFPLLAPRRRPRRLRRTSVAAVSWRATSPSAVLPRGRRLAARAHGGPRRTRLPPARAPPPPSFVAPRAS